MFSGPPLSLGQAREYLKTLENRIVNSLYQRSGYCLNDRIYVPDNKLIINDQPRSLFDFVLWHRQDIDSKLGEFESGALVPFFKDLSKPQKRIKTDDLTINPKKAGINFNKKIRDFYDEAIRRLCEQGDDGKYLLSVHAEAEALIALSERIHRFAEWVADIKYCGNRDAFNQYVLD